MKQTTYLLMALMSISSCWKATPPAVSLNGTDMYIIVDTTDPHTLSPVSDPILELYGLGDDEDKEANFQFTSITDRRLNPVITFHLANGKQTEKYNCRDDPRYREKVVVAFYDSIRATLNGFSMACATMHSLRYSECYRTIATGLCALSKSQALKKWIFVFSDIQENSDIYCCYDTAKQNLLVSSPKIVADLFANSCPLPRDLSGIHAVFVFMPKNRDEDKMYLAMIEVYKLLIESRGGTVTVQADNKNFKP